MSNALSVCDSKFRAIAEGSSFVGSNIDLRSLTTLTIPKTTRWTWDVLGVEFSEKAITGVCVVNGPMEYVVWPHESTSGGDRSPPALRSPDGKRAYRIGDDLGTLDAAVIEAAKVGKDDEGRDFYDATKIPYFQWQRDAKGRNSRRAKAVKTIGVLREGDVSPIMIRLSNTSSPVVHRFYDEVLTKLNCPHWACVCEFSLETVKAANDYTRIVPKFIGTISKEDAEYLHAAYTLPLSPYASGRLDRVVRESVDAVPF